MDYSDTLDMKQKKMTHDKCSHCRGAQYVLSYWLEKMFEQQGMHMTDIPPEAFKLIPVEYLLFCHCNIQIKHFRRREGAQCQECDGTTWLFTETAQEASGYRWKKVADLELNEIRELPCEYFERCSCSEDDQAPKSRKRKEIFEELRELLNIRLPIPRFGI